jgi:Domain of unknown function (DUF5916)
MPHRLWEKYMRLGRETLTLHIFFITLLLSHLPGLLAEEIDWGELQKSSVMTATRIEGEIKLDGILDEEEWNLATPAGDFVQKIPDTGEPATEQTEIRILYNHDTLYIGAHCWDSAGKEGIVVNDITKDFFTTNSDGLQVTLDTFDDDRNCFLFGSNPAEGRFDMQIGPNSSNVSWDGIWYNRTSIDDRGWHLEMAIPFKTLRFTGNRIQQWGINFERRVRRKYEESYWSPMSPPHRLGRIDMAGTLVGLEDIKPSRNMYIKPYVSVPVVNHEFDDWDVQPEAGIEVFKWSVTSQLTLDATMNTDFSQVEVDEVRTNLTRFSLFFPEKRDFFLENKSVFDWGPSSGGRRAPAVLPFFSRRIGLTDGEIVPIQGGARLTGRAGNYTVGVMSMQTDDHWTAAGLDDEGNIEEESEFLPTTNFTVVRVKKDIFSRSEIGGIFVNKDVSGPEVNRTYGFDTNFNFFNYLDINAYALRTESEDNTDEDYASSISASWRDDFWEASASHMRIGEEFNPEVGFVPRSGMYRSRGSFGITPRPRQRIPWVREFNPDISINYITNTDNVLETRTMEAGFSTIFSNASMFRVGYEKNFERLEEDFEIRDGINIPSGDYEWNEAFAFYRSDSSKKFGFSGMVSTGGFWGGDRTNYRGGMQFQPNYKLTAELNVSRNVVDLPAGSFTANLLGTDINYSFSKRMFLKALVQYDSENDRMISNIRYNFKYKPLSDIYIVYNERRDMDTNEVKDRAITLKFTYVLPL